MFHVTRFAVAKASDREQRRRMERLIGQLEPIMSRAFRDGIDRLRGQVDVAALADLLQRGRIVEAMGLLNAELLARGFRPLAREIAYQAVFAGHVVARMAAESGVLAGMSVAFGPAETEVSDWLRRYEMDKIRDLTAEALGTVRSVITNGVTEGRNPLDVARDVRAHIGLTERQSQAVQNYRRALENGDRAALQRALRDRRFDGTVARSLRDAEPLSAQQVKHMVGRYEERYLRHRSETIARTEALRAANGGADLAWRQIVGDGRIPAEAVTRTWYHSHDSKVRDSHRLIPVMNPEGVKLDEPFQSPLGPILFPGDPAAPAANTINCRCTVLFKVDAVMLEQAQRMAA